jgi:chromate reductase
MKILGIIGSLRKNSHNRSLMNAFVAQKPEGVEIELADISTLPFYNEDAESELLSGAPQTLKTQVETADVVIIATPEYNRSVPGVLKNAIDWLSRPYGKNSFSGKKVLVVGASVGPIGTAMAQYDLKKMLLHGNAEIFGQPEFFLGTAGDKFDANGVLTDENTKEHIAGAWARITA